MELKLIEAVQKFPCLFDKSKQEYRNKMKKEKSWASVAAATGATVAQCQSRWRSLRDRYVREVVSAKSGAATEEKRRWCYMEAMSFLQAHIAPRRTFSNIEWALSEQPTLVETLENSSSSSCSLNTSSIKSKCFFGENTNNGLTEEEIPLKKPSYFKKRRIVQRQAQNKFDEFRSAINDLIATKTESCEKSRNSDFLKVLDSYLLKHSEETQDRLKIQILNLVYETN